MARKRLLNWHRWCWVCNQKFKRQSGAHRMCDDCIFERRANRPLQKQ